ncbi:MAG: 50S ribosomal protein L23 [Bacteriovorax sp.]
MAAINDVIVKPLITEKISAESDAQNRYGFVVNLKANKNQIKNAIETFYDVKVVAIRTAIIPGKTKRTSKSVKKTSSYKKALVQLAQGQKIEFFKGI